MQPNIEIKIELAKLEDLNELQILFVETINSTCKNDYNERQLKVWNLSIENKERWINKLNTQYFLKARIDKKIVGFGSLENGKYVDLIYVHKNHLRQGVANLLFENLKNESVRLGFDKLTSDVSITAKPFFEMKGFKIIKKNKNIINDVVIINYHMSV